MPLLPSAAHPRQSPRRSDQGADWPAHSARTVHATVRSSDTHPRPPCPPNPPPARPYPTHVDGNRRRSEQTRRSRRAAPAQQAGANRISAVAVTRATSTYRLGTSVRRSEAPRCCRSREPGSVCEVRIFMCARHWGRWRLPRPTRRHDGDTVRHGTPNYTHEPGMLPHGGHSVDGGENIGDP